MRITSFRHWKEVLGSHTLFVFILLSGCGYGSSDSCNNSLIQPDEMNNNEDIQPEDFSQFIARFHPTHYSNGKDCLIHWCYLIPT